MTEHSTEMGLTLRLSLLQAGEIITETVTESLPGSMAKVHMVSARFWQQFSWRRLSRWGGRLHHLTCHLDSSVLPCCTHLHPWGCTCSTLSRVHTCSKLDPNCLQAGVEDRMLACVLEL